MAHDVFISYSSKDKPTADAVCAMLEGECIRCWIAPRDVLAGHDWGESILEAIKGSRVMVLVLSANANESQHIKREVERAVNLGIPIIPLRVENVMPAASLELFISTSHWLDAFTPPLERHLRYLSQVIQRILVGVPNKPFASRSAKPPPSVEYVREALQEAQPPSEQEHVAAPTGTISEDRIGVLSKIERGYKVVSRILSIILQAVLFAIICYGVWLFVKWRIDENRQQKLQAQREANAVTTPPTPTVRAKPVNSAISANPYELADNLKNGLVLHYTFDFAEAGGKVTDQSDSGNDGRATGARWTAAGHRSGGYQFGGRNNHIRVPNNSSLNPQQLTLATWIKTVNADSISRRIFDKRYDHGFALSMSGDLDGKSFRGQVGLDITPADRTNSYWTHSIVSVADGRWHHVVATYNGEEQRLYMDGQPVGTVRHWSGAPATNDNDFIIGQYLASPDSASNEVSASLNATLDDVMMYSRALSAQEVRTLFSSQQYYAASQTAAVPATQMNTASAGSMRSSLTNFSKPGCSVQLVATTPGTPASLKLGDKLTITVAYSFQNVNGVRIAAYPTKNGGTFGDLTSGSPTYSPASRSGTAQPWFEFRRQADVDQVMIEMSDENWNKLARVIVPVQAHWK